MPDLYINGDVQTDTLSFFDIIGGDFMAVNSYILEELFPDRIAGKITSSKYQYPIKYATIYNPLLRIKPDAVYLVVNPKEFPRDCQNVRSTFVILGHLKPEILEETCHDVICVSSDCGLGKIYETILEQIDLYGRWEEEMNRILLQGGSAEELCQTAVPFFDNPMLIAASDFKVIAVGESKLHPFSKKVQDENGYLSEPRIVSLLSGTVSAQRSENVHFNITFDNKISTLRMTIESHQQVLGYVCIDDTARPFTDADYTRLCMMEQYIRKYVQISPNFRNAAFQNLKSCLSESLHSGQVNAFELRSALNAMQWKMEDTYLCCTLRVRDRQAKQHVANYLCGYMEHHAGGLVTIRHNDNVYALCNLEQMELGQEQWRVYLEKLGTDYGVSAGLSTPFENAVFLCDYFRQAEAALQFCSEQKRQMGVFFFEECRLPYILQHGLGSLPLRVLLTREMQMFLETDAENNFENYKILRCYIRNNLNISETTAELFLHRSSLIYRLDKIKKMLGSDLSQKEEQLYLRLVCYGIDACYREQLESGDAAEETEDALLRQNRTSA